MNKHRWLSFARFKKVRGIEAVVFGLALLFLPVNLAKHFFFDFCYVGGILVDYLIPTVYLTDILIWGLLGFWVFRGFREFSFEKIRFTIHDSRFTIVIFFILISSLSILSAQNQPAAVYKWLKLVEYILFALYVSKHIDLKKDFSTIVKLLSVGVLFESVLAILQWFKQGSVFGFWFFGENRYTRSTPGIATFDLGGLKKVRPYGTFPHPNVLGGYLAVVLPWVFYELKSSMRNKESGIKGRGFYLLTSIFGLVALFLSFSRSAWTVFVLGLPPSFFILNPPFPFHYSSFFILNSLSFLRRAELNWIALQIIKDHPILGVGLNNFTIAMGEYGKVSGWTRFLQPVHNVYLLVAAETGLLGLAIFLCLLFSVFRLLLRNKNYLFLISLSQLFLLCFVDHYFFTLQQGALLFWLLAGLVFAIADKV